MESKSHWLKPRQQMLQRSREALWQTPFVCHFFVLAAVWPRAGHQGPRPARPWRWAKCRFQTFYFASGPVGLGPGTDTGICGTVVSFKFARRCCVSLSCQWITGRVTPSHPDVRLLQRPVGRECLGRRGVWRRGRPAAALNIRLGVTMIAAAGVTSASMSRCGLPPAHPFVVAAGLHCCSLKLKLSF